MLGHGWSFLPCLKRHPSFFINPCVNAPKRLFSLKIYQLTQNNIQQALAMTMWCTDSDAHRLLHSGMGAFCMSSSKIACRRQTKRRFQKPLVWPKRRFSPWQAWDGRPALSGRTEPERSLAGRLFERRNILCMLARYSSGSCIMLGLSKWRQTSLMPEN